MFKNTFAAALLSCASLQTVQASWFSDDFPGPETGTVILTVINATSLDDEDMVGDSDVFVEAEMDEPGINMFDPSGESGYGVKDALEGDNLYRWFGKDAQVVMTPVKDPMNSKFKLKVKDQDFVTSDKLGEWEIELGKYPKIYSYYGQTFYETVDHDIFSRNGRLGFNLRVQDEHGGTGAKSIFGSDDDEEIGAILVSLINATGLDDEDITGDSDVWVKATVDEPGVHMTDPSGKSTYGVKDEKLGDELYTWKGELGHIMIEDVKQPTKSELKLEVFDKDLVTNDDLGDTTIDLSKHKSITGYAGKDFCEVVDRDLLNTGKLCFNVRVIPQGGKKGTGGTVAQSVGDASSIAAGGLTAFMAACTAMLF